MTDFWRLAQTPPPPSKDPDRDYGYEIKSDPVLVFRRAAWGTRIDIASYVRSADPADVYSNRWHGWRSECSEGWELDDVTHWRPLPAPPGDS